MSEAHLSLVTGTGTKRKAIINTETGEVIDDEGGVIAKSIADLANDEEWDLRVKAPIRQLSFDDIEGDGLELLSSTIKIPAGEYGVLGQWRAGDKARLVIEVEIDGVYFQRLDGGPGLGHYGMNRQHVATKPDRVEDEGTVVKRAVAKDRERRAARGE